MKENFRTCINFYFRSIVEDLKLHLDKIESLQHKNLYPTLRNKKRDVKKALTNLCNSIDDILSKIE